MKNSIPVLLLVLCFSVGNSINAQVVAEKFSSAKTEQKAVKTADHEVEILTNFKATKDQKKLINKIKSYVSPRILGRAANVDALVGKTVKLQVSLNPQGNIDYIVVVDGIGSKLDEKVIGLVEEYNEKKPFADSNIAKPAVIQIEIPVVSNKYYGS